MALQLDRRRIYVKGLDTVALRLVDPTGGGDAIVDTDKFYDAGFHESTTFVDTAETEDVYDANGHFIDAPVRSRSVKGVTQLLQTSKDEFDLVINSIGRIYALRFLGMTALDAWQYFCIPQARIYPTLNVEFKVGKRTLPMNWAALFQQGLFSIPYYYKAQRSMEMYVPWLGLWVDPNEALNVGTAKVLDMSGWERHGDVSADYATIWQLASGLRFFRFDGTNDSIDFGNVLSIEAGTDAIVEAWIRFPGSDGVWQEIASKKADVGNPDGWALARTSGNKIRFELGDGSASVTVDTATSVLTNTWKHVAFVIDRDGNATPYLNGVVDGTPASVAGLGESSSTDHLFLGRIGGGYGQVDIGNFRFHKGTQFIPSNIATVISNHYSAERAIYGV